MIAFWTYFIYFAVAAVLLWATGAYAAWKDKKIVAYSATILGLAVFFSYILIMWIALDRPPMRTMGETRLWGNTDVIALATRGGLKRKLTFRQP